jgi:hypothetical protein
LHRIGLPVDETDLGVVLIYRVQRRHRQALELGALRNPKAYEWAMARELVRRELEHPGFLARERAIIRARLELEHRQSVIARLIAIIRARIERGSDDESASG